MAPPSSFSNFLVHRHALPAVHAQFFAAVVKCHEASSVHEAVLPVVGKVVASEHVPHDTGHASLAMAPPASFPNVRVHRHALPAVHAQFFADDV
jgi:hypothetical protein